MNVIRMDEYRYRKMERMLADFSVEQRHIDMLRDIITNYDSDGVAAGLRQFIEEAAKETSNMADPFTYANPWCPYDGNGYTLNENEFEEWYGMTVTEYIDKCREIGESPVRGEED